MEVRTQKSAGKKLGRFASVANWGALATALVCTTGCQQGFYIMYPHNLAQGPKSPATATTNSPPPDPTDPPPLPYLTLRMYTHASSFFGATTEYDSALQVFNLDAIYQTPSASEPVKFGLLAFNLKTKDEFGLHGKEIVRALPIDPTTNQSLNITFTSSAVEDTVADQFIKVFETATSKAGPLLGTMAGPETVVALNTVSNVLDQFKSNDKPTISTRTITLNPVSKDIQSQIQVLFFIPTGGTGTSEVLPETGAQPDPGVEPQANTSEYLKRLEKIRKMTFKLCSNSPVPYTLCSVEPENKEKPFDLFAYVIVVPTLSYRVTFEGFLWKRLQLGGNCVYQVGDIETYESTIRSNWKAMTATQQAAEIEVLRATKSLATIREAVVKAQAGGIFKAFGDEWTHVVPTKQMFIHADTNLPSYNAVLGDLRQCMLREADGFRRGVFYDYKGLLENAREADELKLNPPPKMSEEDIAKKRVEKYERALKYVTGLSSNLVALKINEAEVDAQLTYDRTRMENEIFNLAFQGPIADTKHPTKKEEAVKTLTQLLVTTSCTICKVKADAAIEAASDRKPAPQDVLRVAENLANARGTLAIVQDVAEKRNPSDYASLDLGIRQAEERLIRGIETGKASDIEQANKDALNIKKRASDFIE